MRKTIHLAPTSTLEIILNAVERFTPDPRLKVIIMLANGGTDLVLIPTHERTAILNLVNCTTNPACIVLQEPSLIFNLATVDT